MQPAAEKVIPATLIPGDGIAHATIKVLDVLGCPQTDFASFYQVYALCSERSMITLVPERIVYAFIELLFDENPRRSLPPGFQRLTEKIVRSISAEIFDPAVLISQ